MKYGYFDDINREYVIERPDVPVSWTNYLGVKDLCAVISHNAGGYVFYKQAEHQRITRFRQNGVPLDRYVHPRLTYMQGRELSRFKRGLARSLGRFLGQLHEKRIYHADLKPANIMVREQGQQDWEFILLDLDRVQFDRPLSLKQRARNLAQLDSPFQFRLTRTDRWRAFRTYLGVCPAEDGSRLLRDALRETEKRRQNDQQIVQEQIERLNRGETDLPRTL